MSVTREAIVREARTWLGTPFHHRQCIKGIGVDCVNFAHAVYDAFGLLPPRFSMPDYTLNPTGRELVDALERLMAPVKQQDIQPADLILIAPAEVPRHVGIVAELRGHPSIIHACNASSVRPARVIEHRLMFSRTLKFVAAYRVPGIA